LTAESLPDELFNLRDPFQKKLAVVMASNETSFRLIERVLVRVPDIDLRHCKSKIEALAEIFMFKPGLVIAFCDKNEETLSFIQLVRNNANFRNTPVFAVFTEPQTWRQKLRRGLHIAEKFETPLVPDILYAKAEGVFNKNQ
jgi:hypothetical protein